MRDINCSLAVATLLLAACSDSEAVTDAKSARSSVTQLSLIRSAVEMSNALDARAGVGALLTVTPYIVQGDPARTPPQLRVDDENLAGSGSCTPTACTFSSYGDAGNVVDGSISRTATTLTFDLTDDLSGFDGLLWQLEGSVVVTTTSIGGVFHASGHTAMPSLKNEERDIKVEYDGVTLDATRCPMTGRVHVTSSWDFGAEGESSSYDVAGSVTFDGTGC